MTIVIDASVVLALLLNEDVSSKAESITQGGGLCAPALLSLEVTNGILSAVRRKRMSKTDATALIDVFAMLPIAFDNSANESPKVLAVAQELGLTSYDTIYLLLAQRLHAPLASFNEKLSVAAKSLGIPVLT